MRVIEQHKTDGIASGIGFRITAEMRDAMERLAAERGQRISDVAREAIERHLEATTNADPCQRST